jgi:DNA-binding XRE family transcriptional regulator
MARQTWATRIEKLRQKLNFSQTDFANQLGVSAMAVSRWERGINEPPAKCYVEMGKLAGTDECWYFWERIGISKRDVAKMS